jgi:ABC-2 type transport system permease protein
MMKLLSIEFKKISSYSTFWVFASLYACLLVLLFLGIATFKLPGMPPTTAANANPYFIFPNLWHTLSYTAGWFNLLLGVLMVILITNEFTFRTVRQNIIDGWTVNDFVLAKILLSLVLAICTTIYVFLIGIVYGLIATPSNSLSNVFGQVSFLLAYFVQSMAYLCFALFMGILFRKAGMGIIFFLLYTILIERIIGWVLPNNISDYLPFHTISHLIDFPVQIIGMPVQDSPLGIHFLFALLYSSIFIAASWLLLKKRDN